MINSITSQLRALTIEQQKAIEQLQHSDRFTFTLEDKIFAVYCLNSILVLFSFDGCCGEYIYCKSFTCSAAGRAACCSFIEEKLKND